MKKITRNFY